MKKLRKILKWTGIVLLVLFLTLVITVACRQNLHYEAPYPALQASADSSIVARGRYLVYGPAHCADCHYSPGTEKEMMQGREVTLSGGKPFKLPIATIYVKNITPDSATGIGQYTDPEIARLLRYGVRPDGTAVIDFMPFHNVSDEDMTAILSFLRSQKPITHQVPAHETNVLGKVIKAFMIKPVGPDGPVPKSVPRDTTAAYGKYLTHYIANCRGCHTNRDLMTGAFTGEPFAGGLEIEGFITPNLTPDSTGRLFGWSEEQFMHRFRQGRIYPTSPMPWPSYSRMSNEELKAIYRYLQSIKPVKNSIPQTVLTAKKD